MIIKRYAAVLAALWCLCSVGLTPEIIAQTKKADAKAKKTDVLTQTQYLSGRGCDDMVNWDFFCTDGRNSGKWTKIGVPSCWELQGFGTYQYGMRFYGKAEPEGIANEKGLYKYEFTLPESWEGRQIFLVFEAVMTDAKVTINGRKGGEVHHGGFYRFYLDVSDRIFTGKKKNRLEVEVSKESENTQVNMAERRADYWNFGGIIRPVFVMSKPPQNIRRTAIDAGMDGRFQADVYLNRSLPGAIVEVDIQDLDGHSVGKGTATGGSDLLKTDFTVNNPKLWTAETPNRYIAVFTLKDTDGRTLHEEREKFGFRTIEYRESDGVYINGQKVIFKGVNRHSFRPESGRTLSKEKNIEDVKLIKGMNMNAVRLSHYPADPEFLDACDSLGLYVENELSGWHWAHETIIGQQLVEEMVTRDVNHPSVIFWSNGNEGGFNYELEPFFAKFDPQQRVVLYPWANRNGFETKHYRSWGETAEYMRQKEIFMPTEFLHGLYDGGHGAGLADYWRLMMSNPRCAGGFLWDLADEGVVRTDRDGQIDCVGNFGADGIVGPHFEKEGSYFTIKQVWSPVQVTLSDDQLTIENHYDFTNLKDCFFSYRYLQMPDEGETKLREIKAGQIPSPNVKPYETCTLSLPAKPQSAEVLELAVYGPNHEEEIFTWDFRLFDDVALPDMPSARCQGQANGDTYVVKADQYTYTFSQKNGMLQRVEHGGKTYTLNNGPKFVAARRSDRSFDQFYNHDDKEAFDKKTQYALYADQGEFDGFELKDNVLTVKYRHGSLDEVQWMFAIDGRVTLTANYHFSGVVDLMGICFDYPEEKVKWKRWVGDGPYRVWQNRMEGPQYGIWQNDYNDPIPGESFEYPEFKGYFSHVRWMEVGTTEGLIFIEPGDINQFVGIYQPRDGRDHLLYTLPETGLSVLKVIPAVRNKVNTTDLNGPSAQPHWVNGNDEIRIGLVFD